MTLFTNNTKAGWPGSSRGTDDDGSPLKQILEKNINRINDGYAPPDESWKRALKPGEMSQQARPLNAILLARLNEIDGASEPLSPLQERVKGLDTEGGFGRPVLSASARKAAGGAAGDLRMMSDHDFAQQGLAGAFDKRMANSLHTGDTRGANNTFHMVRTDPYAREMLDLTAMDGQSPESDTAYVKGAEK